MGNVIFIIVYEGPRSVLCDFVEIKNIDENDARRIFWSNLGGSVLAEDVQSNFGYNRYDTDVELFINYTADRFRNFNYDSQKYWEENLVDFREYVYDNPDISLVFEIKGKTDHSNTEGYFVTHDGVKEI